MTHTIKYGGLSEFTKWKLEYFNAHANVVNFLRIIPDSFYIALVVRQFLGCFNLQVKQQDNKEVAVLALEPLSIQEWQCINPRFFENSDQISDCLSKRLISDSIFGNYYNTKDKSPAEILPFAQNLFYHLKAYRSMVRLNRFNLDQNEILFFPKTNQPLTGIKWSLPPLPPRIIANEERLQNLFNSRPALVDRQFPLFVPQEAPFEIKSSAQVPSGLLGFPVEEIKHRQDSILQVNSAILDLLSQMGIQHQAVNSLNSSAIMNIVNIVQEHAPQTLDIIFTNLRTLLLNRNDSPIDFTRVSVPQYGDVDTRIYRRLDEYCDKVFHCMKSTPDLPIDLNKISQHVAKISNKFLLEKQSEADMFQKDFEEFTLFLGKISTTFKEAGHQDDLFRILCTSYKNNKWAYLLE